MRAACVFFCCVSCVPPLALPEDARVSCLENADCPVGVCVVFADGGGCVDAPGACVTPDDPARPLDDGTACTADGDADGACRSGACVRSFCGNGFVDDGEECDDGNGNDDDAPSACRTDCVRPRCGDAVLDDDEECDGGAVAGGVCAQCSVACEIGRGNCDLDVDNGCECALEVLFELSPRGGAALQPVTVFEGEPIIAQLDGVTPGGALHALRDGALVPLDEREVNTITVLAKTIAVPELDARVEVRRQNVFYVDDDDERLLVSSDARDVPIAVAGTTLWVATFVDAEPDVTSFARFDLTTFEGGAVVDVSALPRTMAADASLVCGFGAKNTSVACFSDDGLVELAVPLPTLGAVVDGQAFWLDEAGGFAALIDGEPRSLLRPPSSQALLGFAALSLDPVIASAGLAFVNDVRSADEVADQSALHGGGVMVQIEGRRTLRMLARGGVRGAILLGDDVIVSDGRTVWRAPLP